MSCHSWEFLHYAEELAGLLHALDPPVGVLLGGSVVTSADRDEVLVRGIDEAVLASATTEEIVDAFRRLAHRRHARA